MESDYSLSQGYLKKRMEGAASRIARLSAALALPGEHTRTE